MKNARIIPVIESAEGRDTALVSYRDACGQIVAHISTLLDPDQHTQVARTRRVPALISQAVESTALLTELFTLKSAQEIHQSAIRIMSDPRIPTGNKIAVADHYCAYCNDQDPEWLLQHINERDVSNSYQQMVLATLLLWSKCYNKARALFQAAALDNPDRVCARLLQKAAFWHAQGRCRSTLLCWNQAFKTQKLSPSQVLTLCQFLLDIGRVRSAGRLLSAIPAVEIPGDEVRRLFVQHMVDNRMDKPLRHATRKILELNPAMPSVLRLFTPFVFPLSYRLELPKPRPQDIRLAFGYSHMLRAEWDLGRYYEDSLLVGSKFLVFSGLIREAMNVMAARQQADSSFVDGYAALAVYAWIAGLNREAEECLEQERIDQPHSPTGWFRLALAAGLLRKPNESVIFLERLYQQAPDYFLQNSSVSVWSMLAILLKTLGWQKASKEVAATVDKDPYWPCRRHLLARCPVQESPVDLPPFKWPAQLLSTGKLL